jgi:hypothetical protein
LEECTEFKEFQKEIDRRLGNAGNRENRLAVLGIMLEGKVRELQEQRVHLLSISR